MTTRVELFTSNVCPRCAQARTVLRELVDEFDEGLFELRFVDVVDQLDYAVEIGVMTTPALAVDGELLCAALPGKRKLRELLGKQVVRQGG